MLLTIFLFLFIACLQQMAKLQCWFNFSLKFRSLGVQIMGFSNSALLTLIWSKSTKFLLFLSLSGLLTYTSRIFGFLLSPRIYPHRLLLQQTADPEPKT
jgi:hypothetical protein